MFKAPALWQCPFGASNREFFIVIGRFEQAALHKPEMT